MPTECERSQTSPTKTSISTITEIKQNLTLPNLNEDITSSHNTATTMEADHQMSTSQTSTTSNGSSTCNGGKKTSITSPDPTAYVAKARVTRPTPPPPPYNPMQFVQIKPCNLYQTAQEQLKKAEEVKKIKEIRKEEPEDWQNNLDNWKSSRRKRVEHIIDRVVEVKKLELEEHDRTRRKSKTFSEMMEERGERSGGRGLNKLVSLAVYTEDEANDLSDLGIGTSSASGKSSLSEDYDNNSVMSDNAAELDKAINNSTHNNNNNSSNNKNAITDSTTREYISSPGYETSSSTAPASSPDPCEYTYEGAIQDYKQRVSRAASGLTSVALNKLSSQQQQQQQNSKESTPERPLNKETAYPPRRGSKIEDRLMGFEVQSPSEECVEKNTKVDVPKIDISKRKEIFEAANESEQQPKSQVSTGGAPRVTLRDRFKVQENTEPLTEQPKKELKRLSGDITSIKERLQSLEKQQSLVNDANGAIKTTANKLVDIPVPPLKERLSSLQNAVTKEEVRKPPVVLVDARQLEIMKSEEEKAQMNLKETKKDKDLEKVNEVATKVAETTKMEDAKSSTEVEDIDRDDSGIHTADDVDIEEKVQADIMKKEQELKLNAAIEALAKEEKQLSDAANAVNQIEAEFEELTLGSVALPPLASNQNGATAATQANINNDHMEYSVSSTNPTNEISSSNNDNNSNLNNNNNDNTSSSTCSNSSGSGPNSSISTETVKGLDFKSATNLKRKPTNEMVHAKNLLKIFKETFQNDIELDEQEVNEEQEVKDIKEQEDTKKKCEDLSLNIKTQIFENSKNKIEEKPIEELNETANKEESISKPNTPNTPSTPLTPSMIPRSMTPLGKPPMSPQSLRAHTKFMSATPPGSPSLARKQDSQFSINGRVEIFNSKTMTSTPSNVVKPLTPTMTTKKTQLPYINAPKTTQSNNIALPQQQQLQQDATAKSFTVIEPLSTTVAATAATAATATNTAGNNQTNENNVQLKSMPSSTSKQMVNEPQTKLDGRETYHQHQNQTTVESTNHNNELVKQQQPEVVMCAPPITIVNPDELPKPNTVKNLSSCFQQQQQDNSHAKVPLPAPKPLPRSRIPQATPPPSPVLPRRHICYTSESSKESESNKLSPTLTPIDGDAKKLSLNTKISPLEEDKKLSTSSNCNKLSPTPSPLEEEKKLSVISSSSTSSTSTASTVIDAKKLSVISNNSNTSEDVKPTFGQTQAQIHKEPEKSPEIIEEPREDFSAKVLNKEATQALVEEMINADKQARTLILDTKNLPPKPKDLRPLSPLKIDIDKAQDKDNKSNTSPLSPPAQTKEIKTPSPVSPASKPFSSPLAPLHSPKSELFKTTTPLVVSTLYDKYQPTPLQPNNQRTPLAPLKPTTPKEPDTPSIIIPAELPNLPDCPPNESSLYKIASAPHSPKSPSSEKNLALDAAICNSLLTSLAVTPNVMQRQYTVEEDLCQKVDKDTLPFHSGSTGFKDISKDDIKKCDGLTPSSAHKLQGSTQRQITVEEELCKKIDVNTLPDGKQEPITGYKSVSPTDIRKCDNFFTTGSAKPSSKPNSKPSSPIMQAREAHSKALIETCEKIIAEELLASSQMKSSLPSSPVGTPIMQRKSKIPKPITSCCKATESLTEADLKPTTPTTPTTTDNNGVIARMHVVETQIKVTTTTPPASPKVSPKPQASPQSAKKTKNIFDFLKKNFGVGGHSHKDEQLATESEEKQNTPTPKTESLPATPSSPEHKVLVLSEQELRELEKVQYDEIHNIDNSKFYIPTKELEEAEDAAATPPPLPKTPAPVNIEITRKVITNEILEDGKTEQDITKEIDELLDDELNKLNQEIEELEKAGRKQ